MNTVKVYLDTELLLAFEVLHSDYDKIVAQANKQLGADYWNKIEITKEAAE
jgi:hypothetical protein